MTAPTIQSQDISVATIFQAFYAVPDYQREYVWQADQVEQLLRDVLNEQDQREVSRAPEYFIGSIVVCPGSDGVLDLIDGQQRMTTLFLCLCAIRDRLTALKQNPPGAIAGQIAATSTDLSGHDHFRYRLDLQYEDSGKVLERVAKGERYASDEKTTRSIDNVLNAYEVIVRFLKTEFGDDADAIRGFYGYLTNKVKLIRIQTENVAKALKIFETINDRGVGLDSMDLLKNLLFMKANREQFETLKNTWKELQDAIFDAGEKPLRFLRYFIFSNYDVEALREDEIYEWLSKNEKLCGYGKDPIAFAKYVLVSAKAYCNFLKGMDAQGHANRYLKNLQILGGKAARQHLIPLLTGRSLPLPLFNRLAKEVEDLFFAYVITREHTRDFEKGFARWAMDLRHVTDEAGLIAFVAKTFQPAKAELANRFQDAFLRLKEDDVQQYRLRYILAKLTQSVDLQAYGETEGTRWLSRYAEQEIEHIHPQKPDADAVAEFGVMENQAVTRQLGNLVLLEKSINASLRNRPYSHKKNVYRESQLLLTRALTERPKVGSNTMIDAAVAEIEPYATWNEAAVRQRQAHLTTLARRVWNI